MDCLRDHGQSGKQLENSETRSKRLDGMSQATVRKVIPRLAKQMRIEKDGDNQWKVSEPVKVVVTKTD